MKSYESIITNVTGSFPTATAKNSTGAATTDGSEFVAGYINNFVVGIAQAVMNYAGLTPDGVIEADGASQYIEAMQKGAALLPGLVMEWNLNVDPAAIGFRGLLLSGQGVLRANIPELDANNYVGDGNNAAVAAAGGAYFRADNADGSSPAIDGIYLILPESRGYAPRGLDVAASIDPQGASRKLGDNQTHDVISHDHDLSCEGNSGTSGVVSSGTGSLVAISNGLARIGTPSTPITLTSAINAFGGSETVMTNRSTKWVVIY